MKRLAVLIGLAIALVLLFLYGVMPVYREPTAPSLRVLWK
jgi:hypothetical protein